MAETNHLFLGLDHKAQYPGKTVTGFIVLVVQKPITVSQIIMEFKGVEFVSWYQGVTQKEHCSVTSNIFDDTLVLLHAEEGHTFLDVGTYTYPFEWLLPEKIPASYEEAKTQTGGVVSGLFTNYVIPENGLLPMSFGDQKSYIRYFCKAIIDTVVEEEVEGKTELEVKTLRMQKDSFFNVVEQFDPAILIQKPKKISTKRQFFLSGDPVELRISLANGGVLFTGQNLFLHLYCKNGSTRNVNQLTMRIVEHVAFTAYDSKEQEQLLHRKDVVLQAIIEDSLIPKAKSFDKDLMLPIPGTIAGTIHCSNHISRQYEIIVEAEMQIGGKVTVALPLLFLNWSPLIKDDVPSVVPIKISRKKVKEQDKEQDDDIESDDEVNSDISDEDSIIKDETSESVEAVVETLQAHEETVETEVKEETVETEVKEESSEPIELDESKEEPSELIEEVKDESNEQDKDVENSGDN